MLVWAIEKFDLSNFELAQKIVDYNYQTCCGSAALGYSIVDILYKLSFMLLLSTNQEDNKKISNIHADF